jgi:hypothetical protein
MGTESSFYCDKAIGCHALACSVFFFTSVIPFKFLLSKPNLTACDLVITF